MARNWQKLLCSQETKLWRLLLVSRWRILPCESSLKIAAAWICALAFSSNAYACWNEAAERYHVNPYLLYAIAKTESGLNANALNRNNNGSTDIGLMQINSYWLPVLRKYGIDKERLFDPCVSIHVGAWILAQNQKKLGNTWTAVGAYNAVSPDKRIKYASKVYKNLPFLQNAAADSKPVRTKYTQHKNAQHSQKKKLVEDKIIVLTSSTQ